MDISVNLLLINPVIYPIPAYHHVNESNQSPYEIMGLQVLPTPEAQKIRNTGNKMKQTAYRRRLRALQGGPSLQATCRNW